jgi:hypothetical protein
MTPSKWDFFKAGMRYRRDRWRAIFRKLTFRCPSCPGKFGGHKFSCYVGRNYNGIPISLRKAKKQL